MADLEKRVKSSKELVEELFSFLNKEKCSIRLLNVKVSTDTEESRWYCDVNLSYDGECLKILENENLVNYDFSKLKQIKIRPFYYAACIGNKNLVFHLEN